MKNAKPSTVWHYTVGNKLPLIAAAGALLPRGVRIAPKELPVCWFSGNEHYEPTAVKLVQMPGADQIVRPSMAELHQLIGIYRFAMRGTDERLLHWPQLQFRARIPPEGAASMVLAGIEVGAKPMDWFGTMVPVQLEDLDFQAWNGNEWMQADLLREIRRIDAKLDGVESESAAAFGVAAIRQAWTA